MSGEFIMIGGVLLLAGVFLFFLGLAMPIATAIPWVGWFMTHLILIPLGVLLVGLGFQQPTPAAIVAGVMALFIFIAPSVSLI